MLKYLITSLIIQISKYNSFMHSLYSFKKSQEKLQKAQQEEEKFQKVLEKREEAKLKNIKEELKL